MQTEVFIHINHDELLSFARQLYARLQVGPTSSYTITLKLSNDMDDPAEMSIEVSDLNDDLSGPFVKMPKERR